MAYMHLPVLLFGIGHYNIRIELPEAANLYATGNVTYRGTEVGRVTAVHLTDTGVEAVLSLKSDVKIPSDLEAQVHSATAIGEQYVALLPRNAASPPLKDGDVIPLRPSWSLLTSTICSTLPTAACRPSRMTISKP